MQKIYFLFLILFIIPFKVHIFATKHFLSALIFLYSYLMLTLVTNLPKANIKC